jgi:hypothetical protein
MAISITQPSLGSTSWFTAVDDNWTAIKTAFQTAATFSGTLTVGSLTSGRLPFASTGGLLADSAQLLWDNTNLRLSIQGASGLNRSLRGAVGAAALWSLNLGNSAAIAGSDSGADLTIQAFTDAGVLIDVPVSITRASGGTFTIVRPFSQTGATTFSTGTGAVTLNGATTIAANLAVTGVASKISAVAFAPTSLSGSELLLNLLGQANPASANSGNLYIANISAESRSTCAQNFTASANPGICGITSAANHFGTGVVTFLAGGNFIATGRLSGGNITRANGLVASVYNSGAITITDASALWASAVTNTGGGTVTRAMGLTLIRQTAGTSNFALMIGTPAGTGNWAIYNSTGDPNYFGVGQALFGTTSAISHVSGASSYTPGVQVAGTSAATSGLALSRWFADVNPPNLVFGKARAGIGTFSVVNSGDCLGAVTWNGADGTQFREAATLRAVVDGAPGSSDMPGKIIFATTADGAATATDRLAIDNAGQIQGLATTNSTSDTTGALVLAGGLGIKDAKDIGLGTTSGTKLGTSAAQKLGFWGATPIVQKSGYGTPTGGSQTINFPAATATPLQTAQELAQLLLDLKAAGILGA